MAYEYEGKLLDYASGSKTYEEFKAMTQELEEVYRKAKVFDKILNLIEENYVDYGENNLEDIEAIVNEYWED